MWVADDAADFWPSGYWLSGGQNLIVLRGFDGSNVHADGPGGSDGFRGCGYPNSAAKRGPTADGVASIGFGRETEQQATVGVPSQRQHGRRWSGRRLDDYAELIHGRQ